MQACLQEACSIQVTQRQVACRKRKVSSHMATKQAGRQRKNTETSPGSRREVSVLLPLLSSQYGVGRQVLGDFLFLFPEDI